MKILKIMFGVTVLLLLSQPLLALPTFQTYIEGATAGDYNGDQDTWFTTDSSFSLIVVGAYSSKTVSLTEATLLLSVPQGETGAITITGGDGVILLTEKTAVDDGYYNPNSRADIDLLTNEPGNTDGFDGYQTKNFLPDDTFNNHYPLQDDVSDFLIYGIGDFDPVGEIHNYNADTDDSDYVPPPIPFTTGSLGEEKTFAVSIDGFSWVHWDVYGYETRETGCRLKSTWDINPGSHDATYIPAPGAILLGGIGIGLVGWLRRQRAL